MDFRGFECFKKEGNWYKGNLHSHTTNSDGRATPQEVADWYYRHGYDFLAITDHDVITDVAPLQKEGFLVIPGIEFGYAPAEEPGFFLDMLGIHMKELPEFLDPERKGRITYNPDMSPQQIIDYLNENDGIAIMCHPYFMINMTEPYLKYRDYVGVEAYNYVCEAIRGRGNQEIYWDTMLFRNKRLWGFATDDSHAPEFGYGWIHVKAKENTLPAILDAIREGSFYSTTGIQIYDLEYTKEKVKIVFDRPCDVVFMAENGFVIRSYDNQQVLVDGRRRFYVEGDLTKIPNFKYLRLELVDSRGKKAYTNPVFFD